MGHSINSPSGFSRRRACPGSAKMEAMYPESTNVYAAQGTAAHNLAEYCLMSDDDAHNHIGEKFGEYKHEDGTIEEFIVDGEMADAVQIYLDHCRPLMNEHTLIEEKLELPFLGKDEKGTADFASLKDRRLKVSDYKHGVGIVDAYRNIQGLCYGLGVAEQYYHLEWDFLDITIVQPRAYHHEGAVRTWSVPREELLDWKLDFAEAAVATQSEEVVLHAGEHCRFCKARNDCKERLNYIGDAMSMDLLDPNSKPIDQNLLTDEQKVDLLFNKIPDIEKWVSNFKDSCQQQAEEKNPLPGTKLVETRAKRMWKDAAEAEAALGGIPGAMKQTFVTAPQMEKLVGKKKFKDFETYVVKKSTGVTLVHDSDPRPNARPSGAEEFAPVSENLFD